MCTLETGSTAILIVASPAVRCNVLQISAAVAVLEKFLEEPPKPIPDPDADTDRMRAVWRTGNCVLGAWLSLPCTFTAEIIGASGFDAVTIDLQHGSCNTMFDGTCIVSHVCCFGTQ